MNYRVLIRATIYALLVALAGARANAADPTASSGQVAQANDTSSRRTSGGGSVSGPKEGTNTRDSTARHEAGPIPLHGRSALPVAHVPKPPTGGAAHGYVVRRAGSDHPDSRSGSTAVATAGTSPAAHGISGAMLPSNAIRSSSGIPGATGRSAGSFHLNPLAGNGTIGGPRPASHGVIGGPGNNRTVIRAGIDGNAFHHRS
jgi:hypothetical protein